MKHARMLAAALAALVVATTGAVLLWPGSDSHEPHRAPDEGGADRGPSSAGADGADAATSATTAAGTTQQTPATIAPTTGPAPSLPVIEQQFLRNGQVQLEVLRGSLTSDRFNRDFDMLDSAMRQSADAVALRDAYRDAIARQATRAGLADAPQRLACGTDVCLGSVVVPHGDAGYSTWWNDFTSSSATPQGTAIDFPRTLADGRIEHRFFFSMDPAANRAVLPNPR